MPVVLALMLMTLKQCHMALVNDCLASVCIVASQTLDLSPGCRGFLQVLTERLCSHAMSVVAPDDA